MKFRRIPRSLSRFVPAVSFAACLAATTPGCENTTPPTGPDYDAIESIVFSEHVAPLLTGHCATSGCHSSGDRAAGLSLASWEEITAGSDRGECILPFRPERSLLTLLFDGTSLRRSHPPVSHPPSAEATAFLKRWIAGGARNDAGTVPFEGSAKKVYVPNQGEDNVSVIDAEALVVTKIVPVGTSAVVEGPHFVAADADYWYVSLINAGEVWKFDARADTLVARARVSGAPALLALTPDGKKLYVSQFTTVFSTKLSVVNTVTMTVAREIPLLSMPHGLRMNRAGTIIYAASMMSDAVSAIDVAADTVLAHILLAHDVNPTGSPKYMPMEVAVSPNDSLVAVACSETREVRIIDAAALAVVDSFGVGDQPWHLQFTPDGAFCLVTNRREHSVSAIHLPMRHVMKEYRNPADPAIFNYPHGLDISSDGRHTFVSNENTGHAFIPRYNLQYVGNVVVIDNVLAEVVKVLEVGRMPTGLGVTP